MKRSSALEASDQENAVRGSDLTKSGKPRIATSTPKAVELAPLSKKFPDKNKTATNEAANASLTKSGKHDRTRSSTLAKTGDNIGHKIGASKLHWLKRNWVLCALILFALLGLFLAIIMVSLPCESIFKDVSVTMSKRANTTYTYSQVECALPGGSMAVPGLCPVGTEQTTSVVCSKDTCTTSDGTRTTDMDQCQRTPWLTGANEPCRTEVCYTIDVLRECTSTTMCKNAQGTTVPQICGAQQVKGCAIEVGGAGGSTSEHWYPQVNGACASIELCTYCVRTSNNVKEEYPSSGVCPGGTRKDVMTVPTGGCPTGRWWVVGWCVWWVGVVGAIGVVWCGLFCRCTECFFCVSVVSS